MRTTPMMFVTALFLVTAACLSIEPAAAQVRSPVVSPYATLSEEVGLTDITITYGRPAVNGRAIWGGQVPYGLAPPLSGFGAGNAFPWRAGANENTTIRFEHDVLIEGKPLAAGTYGLHMIPSQSDWVVIFSENSTSWGSFFYNEAEDALRVTVTPTKAPHKERLTYEFMNHDGQGGVTVALLWEELSVPFRVQVDHYHDVVMASMRNQLRSTGGFGWQGYVQAATYALQNNVNLEEALQWTEVAIARNRAFNTLSLKAGLLAQMGRVDEGIALMEEVLPTANENQLNAYGYQLMARNKREEAHRIFEMNIERYPDSWNPLDSLGEYYANVGDSKNARKYYQMALDKLPDGDQTNHDRITQILAGLDAGGSN